MRRRDIIRPSFMARLPPNAPDLFDMDASGRPDHEPAASGGRPSVDSGGHHRPNESRF
jgi:hypothetical protein